MGYSKEKYEAIGEFMIICGELDRGVKGGRQKLQKIIGKSLFFKNGSSWFYGIQKIKRKSVLELKNLTKKVKESL